MKMKKYPFAWSRNAHSIQLRHDALLCELCDLEDSWTGSEEDMRRCRELTELKNRTDRLMSAADFACRSDGVTWLTGRDLAFARECVAWAEEFRASRNGMSWEEINAMKS